MVRIRMDSRLQDGCRYARVPPAEARQARCTRCNVNACAARPRAVQPPVMALPPPYLAGPARFDVGLKPIDPARWLLPDDEAAWLPGKAALIERDPDAVFRQGPGSLEAQAELVEVLAERAGLHVPPTGEPPLLAASRLVSDDLVLLAVPPDGADWSVVALSLCSPTFFDAAHAIGGSLARLHGPVPGGDPGLAGRIGRVFSMLRPDQVLERLNWTVQWGPDRYAPSGAPLRAAAAAAPVEAAAALLHERVERQTIRKLPRTQAVLFTIRVRLTPLAVRLADPPVRAAFADAWYRSAGPVRAYKHWASLERHVAHLLGS